MLFSFNPCVVLIGQWGPLIYDVEAEIYNNQGINFNTLKHLDEIGLLSFDNLGGYRLVHLDKKIRVAYYGKPIEIEFEKDNDNELSVGKVLLSKVGNELAPICGSKPIPEFFDFIIEDWTIKKGMNVSSPIRVISKDGPA